MHVSNTQRLLRLARRTSGGLVLVALYSTAVVALYRWTDGQWISFPWGLLAFPGLSLAVSTGFKAFHRRNHLASGEATWASIHATSRSWALLAHAALGDQGNAQTLVERHLVWLAALRRELRWNDTGEPVELTRGVDVRSGQQGAEGVLRLQSAALKSLRVEETLDPASFTALHSLLQQMQSQRVDAMRFREDPATGRHSIVDTVLLWSFGLLLPFGLLDAMSPLILFDDTFTATVACWVVVPLAALLQGMFLALHSLGSCEALPGDADHITSAANAFQSLESELKAWPSGSAQARGGRATAALSH